MVLLGFLVFAAAEVAAFVAVAGQIGVLAAVVLLLLVSLTGPLLVRRAGVEVLAQTRARLDRGEAPTAELLDGLVALVGGVLVCIPGFVGDAAGLALLAPPVRRAVIRLAGRHLARRVSRAPGWRWTAAAGRPGARPVVDAASRSARHRPGAGRDPAGPPDPTALGGPG